MQNATYMDIFMLTVSGGILLVDSFQIIVIWEQGAFIDYRRTPYGI